MFLFNLPLEKQQNLWILTSNEMTDPGWCQNCNLWFVVLAARPSQVLIICMEMLVYLIYLLTSSYYHTLYKAKQASQSEKEKLYAVCAAFGPVARTCLQEISITNDQAYEWSLRSYFHVVNEGVGAFISSGEYSDLDDPVMDKALAKLSILEPINNREFSQLLIATRLISFCIFQSAKQAAKLSFYGLYQNIS
ncbi:unnamed protein product [Tuber aestivum]|uniref:Uncharacterized protein n=1 Tax=Tuber aestivum TaxID=59557 RepID=A0A292PZ46_9PEZI|nr:unnamed protein product [Tuber aestivum]